MKNNEINNALQNKKSSFFYSFFFLSRERRIAINTLYTFCDVSDDIVDCNDTRENKRSSLIEWRNELSNCIHGKSKYSLQNQVGALIDKYGISISLFHNLLDGMEMDLNNQRYTTFEDLFKYCYNVASTVGLISIKIFGYKNPKSIDYAINLGIALQLTNIIRDIKQDSLMGRIYLPLEELIRFNVSEKDIVSNTINENFISLMQFQYNRIIYYYNKAEENLCAEDKKYLVAARIMRNIYFRILMKIKKNKYNVFDQKIKLSRPEKIYIALKTYLSN